MFQAETNLGHLQLGREQVYNLEIFSICETQRVKDNAWSEICIQGKFHESATSSIQLRWKFGRHFFVFETYNWINGCNYCLNLSNCLKHCAYLLDIIIQLLMIIHSWKKIKNCHLQTSSLFKAKKLKLISYQQNYFSKPWTELSLAFFQKQNKIFQAK